MKTGLIGALSALVLALGAAGAALSDHDHDDEEEGHEVHSRDAARWRGGRDVDPVTNPVYRDECGGCHLAYPPGLLPADGWRRVMGDLANHYGDDASLESAIADPILDYLVANSADANSRVRSRAFAVAFAPGKGPPRITETLYFQRKHDEIPQRLVRDNPGVRSFSRCDACHSGAEQGRFNEDLVRIPGVGRWDD
jgi:hypothetical protein